MSRDLSVSFITSYLEIMIAFCLTFFFFFYQMILYLAEASRHFGCTDIFKEPSKFALSDCYEDHFIVPYQRIVLVTNKRVMLLQVGPWNLVLHSLLLIY